MAGRSRRRYRYREGSPGLPDSTSDGQAITSSHLTTIWFARVRAQEAIGSPPLLTSQRRAGSLLRSRKNYVDISNT
jgi:hypothetical protein